MLGVNHTLATARALLDAVRDPDIGLDDFFAKATWCLVTSKPQTLLEVLNQGRTLTCYAHVMRSLLYGAEVKEGRIALEGSRQEILDYIHEYRRPRSVPLTGPFPVPSGGFCCSYRGVFRYVMDNGLSLAEKYPWTGSCKFRECSGEPWDRIVTYGKSEDVVNIDDKIQMEGYVPVHANQIEEVLHHQPVSGCVALTDELRAWVGDDIFRGQGELIEEAAHAVTIVGYGSEGDEKYFICQNSYGIHWGHKGYFKILQNLVTLTYIPKNVRSPAGPPGQGGVNEDVGQGQEGGEEEDTGAPNPKRQCTSKEN